MMTLHRDVTDSQCGGQVTSGYVLFNTDWWCVYCGAKFNAPPPQRSREGAGHTPQ